MICNCLREAIIPDAGCGADHHIRNRQIAFGKLDKCDVCICFSGEFDCIGLISIGDSLCRRSRGLLYQYDASQQLAIVAGLHQRGCPQHAGKCLL
ncbi:hypothetical protein D3C78_1826240 [compost metagenome]